MDICNQKPRVQRTAFFMYPIGSSKALVQFLRFYPVPFLIAFAFILLDATLYSTTIAKQRPGRGFLPGPPPPPSGTSILLMAMANHLRMKRVSSQKARMRKIKNSTKGAMLLQSKQVFFGLVERLSPKSHTLIYIQIGNLKYDM